MQTMASLEEDFQNLVKRLSVLRVLLDRTSDGSQVDWVGFVRTMENDDELGGLFWNRIARDALPAEADNRDASEQHARGLAVAKWHDLIADAISLMSDSVDPADMRTASLAERYRQLELDRAGSLDQMFILAENIAPHRGGPGSFNELRDNVARYLGEVVRAHGHGKDGDS